jgi:rubrerythrin
MNSHSVKELLLQSLEHERGGMKVYKAALGCAQRTDLKREWSKFLRQTEDRLPTLAAICEVFDVDSFTLTPGVEIVRSTDAALVKAMEAARATGNLQAAQIVAAECVVLAETKDHLHWELLGAIASKLSGVQRELLQEAFEQIAEEEDQHLNHTQGWCRELWLEALGLPAELPPPEGKRHEVVRPMAHAGD